MHDRLLRNIDETGKALLSETSAVAAAHSAAQAKLDLEGELQRTKDQLQELVAAHQCAQDNVVQLKDMVARKEHQFSVALQDEQHRVQTLRDAGEKMGQRLVSQQTALDQGQSQLTELRLAGAKLHQQLADKTAEAAKLASALAGVQTLYDDLLRNTSNDSATK